MSSDALIECPRCGLVDDPAIPGVHGCSGMRRCEPHPLPPEVQERLRAFMDEADRCRGRAAAEARNAWIG